LDLAVDRGSPVVGGPDFERRQAFDDCELVSLKISCHETRIVAAATPNILYRFRHLAGVHECRGPRERLAAGIAIKRVRALLRARRRRGDTP
jgi:hypothetical protein